MENNVEQLWAVMCFSFPYNVYVNLEVSLPIFSLNEEVLFFPGVNGYTSSGDTIRLIGREDNNKGTL